MSAKLACSVLPTMEICPNCKSEMTIKEVTPICADGFEDVTHRCKIVSFGNEAHVQRCSGVGTSHTRKFFAL
jgi:hypothetical protein